MKNYFFVRLIFQMIYWLLNVHLSEGKLLSDVDRFSLGVTAVREGGRNEIKCTRIPNSRALCECQTQRGSRRDETRTRVVLGQ